MKYLPALSLSATLAFVSCESMTAPLTTSGSFDPLSPAGGVVNTNTSTGPTFKPGKFIQASMDNTAFFLKRPKGDGDADKLLPMGTQMKVITSDSSYVKVELDSGEVGFVPAVMVNDPSAPVEGLDGAPGAYPPVDPNAPVEPLPTFDTSGLPPPGTIPPVIQDEAITPAPAGATPPPAGTTPPAPPASGTAPLPPGIDSAPAEEKAQ